MANRMPGRTVKCRGDYTAFVPGPLPPQLKWSQALLRSLSDADRLIGRLAGESGRFPNPHLLIRPFVQCEAVLSSHIEGTQATLGELLAAEAGAVVERSPADLREVANYVVALEYGAKRLKTLPLSLRLVTELHDRLMKGVRGGSATPGEFRRSQNWIGPAGCTLANAVYIPPPPEELMNCLGKWEKFLHDRSLPPLIQAALMHCQFEAIHPFLDGNGRVGRLLIILFLLERKILQAPLLYLSAFFDATSRDYYERLQGVYERGEWDAWIEYFLNGIARQSEDALHRASLINALLEKWRLAVASSGLRTAVGLIEMLGRNPYCTIKKIAHQLKVAFTTAQRAVGKLKELGIVMEVTDARRNRLYCARDILDILEEPPNLSPRNV